MVYFLFLFFFFFKLQVQSWDWATSRQSWTAYPTGKLTRTCPMPTTPPPPTARTHEEQRTSTLLSFYSLLCTSLLPSTFNLHFIIKNAVRVGSGGRMGGQILSFSSLSPRRELAISSPLRLLSPTPRSCPLVLFLVGFFFVFSAVTPRTSLCHCYMQVRVCGESGDQLGWEGEGEKGLTESEDVLCIHLLWWYS